MESKWNLLAKIFENKFKLFY